MTTLFDDDPVYETTRQPSARHLPIRDRLGRFCTKEQKYIETIRYENNALRKRAEVYLQSWLAAERTVTSLQMENQELRRRLITMNNQ